MTELIGGTPRRGWLLHAAGAAVFIVSLAALVTYLIGSDKTPDFVDRPPSDWPQAEDRGIRIGVGTFTPEVPERQVYASIDMASGRLTRNAQQLPRYLRIELVIAQRKYPPISIQATQLQLPANADHARIGLILRFGTLPLVTKDTPVDLNVIFPAGLVNKESADITLAIKDLQRLLK